MIILLAAAVLPAAYLLSRVYRMDTSEKEPFSLLRKLLLWGAISGVPAALAESPLSDLWDSGCDLLFDTESVVTSAIK